MIKVRPAGERGRTRAGWLDSSHSFSFGDYYAPRHMGFRDLRVIDEDYVAPGAGFGTHSHRDMEIISVALSGGLAHRDSTGKSGVIRPGEVQVMTVGTGVGHSEMNASKSEPVHFLQIWILPERDGLRPGYGQKAFPDEGERAAAPARVTRRRRRLARHPTVREALRRVPLAGAGGDARARRGGGTCGFRSCAVQSC